MSAYFARYFDAGDSKTKIAGPFDTGQAARDHVAEHAEPSLAFAIRRFDDERQRIMRDQPSVVTVDSDLDGWRRARDELDPLDRLAQVAYRVGHGDAEVAPWSALSQDEHEYWRLVADAVNMASEPPTPERITVVMGGADRVREAELLGEPVTVVEAQSWQAQGASWRELAEWWKACAEHAEADRVGAGHAMRALADERDGALRERDEAIRAYGGLAPMGADQARRAQAAEKRAQLAEADKVPLLAWVDKLRDAGDTLNSWLADPAEGGPSWATIEPRARWAAVRDGAPVREVADDPVPTWAEVDGTPMPVFVIKAKDRLAQSAIVAYRRACTTNGLPEQAVEVGKALDEILLWQAQHAAYVQLPDHVHVPARAIGTVARELAEPIVFNGTSDEGDNEL